MREVKDFHQAQIIINELLDWKSRLENKDWDFHQLKIKNAGDGVDPRDYVTLRQLPMIPTIPDQADQFFTIVWTRDSIGNGQTAPSWVTGLDRDGIPHEVWMRCETAPSGGPFTINMVVNGVTLLTNNLSIANGQKGPSFTSSFVTPVPRLAKHSTAHPTIITTNAVGIISIGLVIKRNA